MSHVAKLIYSSITSLDGFIEDATGSFEWSEPDDEVHTFINDLFRPVGTHLYGRRLYEVMAVWETLGTPDQPTVMRDFAQIWKAVEKIVYSRTLEAPMTPRTRIEPEFNVGAVAQMKQESDADMIVGGAELAATAFRAGLVDECHQFVVPVAIGGGKPFLPRGVRLDLELLDERRFGNGTVYLRYAVRS